jgi:hypothetical protein
MRYGHAINTDAIPEDPNEAEFPEEPLPQNIVIRVKSLTNPQMLPAPLSAGGDPSCQSAPRASTTWTGPALGQAPPISAAAAGLTNYVSPNQVRHADGELQEDVELSRLRGTQQTDEEICKLIAWTTRKDYPTNVGISLPTRNWVGEDYHAIQFWEDVEEPIHTSEQHAAAMYAWICERLAGRSQASRLPTGMPDTFQNLSVRTYKDAKAGYILYEPLDSLADNLTDIPVKAQIEYHNGYAKLGMGDLYWLRMLA